MDFTFSTKQERLNALCKELAEDFSLREAEHDRDRTDPQENYDKLRDAGL